MHAEPADCEFDFVNERWDDGVGERDSLWAWVFEHGDGVESVEDGWDGDDFDGVDIGEQCSGQGVVDGDGVACGLVCGDGWA